MIKKKKMFENSNPLGSWDDLKPSIAKQISAIIKSRFLIKSRDKAAIIEILFSFIIIFVSSLAFFFTQSTYQLDQNPKIEKVGNQSIIDWFSRFGKNVIVVCIPDKPLMHYLIGNTTTLKIAIEGGSLPNTNVTFTGAKLFYYNTKKELKNAFFKANSNAIGFEWENIDDGEESLLNPRIAITIQTIFGNPNIDFFIELRNSILKMLYSMKNESIETSLSLNTTLYKSNFAHPEIKRISNVYSFAYGIISCLICVIVSISDLELLFSEKQSRFLAFSFLMGMSETAFWVANFVISFVISLIGYIIVSLVFSFWFGLKGNDFSMILVISVFYIIAELWFQYFLSTFTHNNTSGRWITISIVMIAIATGFLFQFTAFYNPESSSVVVNMFTLLPFSMYELFIMQGAFAVSDNLPLYKWNNMTNSQYSCAPYYVLTFLIVDIFIYFILFLILNALLPRQYGNPPFKVKNCFKKLKRNKKTKMITETHGSDDENEYRETVIDAVNLTKKYKKMKDSKALDGVSFTVKKGEVILVIGPNGAGKSTLINCLSGIDHFTDGDFSIFDDFYPPSIGICFQDDLLIKTLTIKEHFDLFGAIRGVPPKILEDSVDYLCSVLNLSKIKNQRAGNLSGGQKRKLCIALSLLGCPKVLLLDEPTTGVDVPGRLLIWRMFSTLKDTTFVVVSHELEEAEYVSSRLFIMNDGKISFSGTSTELKQEYKCGYDLRLNFDNGNSEAVLKLAKEFVPEAEMSEDREDVIRIPDSKRISEFLFALADRKTELGIQTYTFSMEQFEDVLMNIVYQ